MGIITAERSINELIQILLDEYGISAHRVTVYEDIEQLKASGMDIYTLKSRQNKYYLASRLFDLPELKLLIDAVESSKFITEKKAAFYLRSSHLLPVLISHRMVYILLCIL